MKLSQLRFHISSVYKHLFSYATSTEVGTALFPVKENRKYITLFMKH